MIDEWARGGETYPQVTVWHWWWMIPWKSLQKWAQETRGLRRRQKREPRMQARKCIWAYQVYISVLVCFLCQRRSCISIMDSWFQHSTTFILYQHKIWTKHKYDIQYSSKCFLCFSWDSSHHPWRSVNITQQQDFTLGKYCSTCNCLVVPLLRDAFDHLPAVYQLRNQSRWHTESLETLTENNTSHHWQCSLGLDVILKTIWQVYLCEHRHVLTLFLHQQPL